MNTSRNKIRPAVLALLLILFAGLVLGGRQLALTFDAPSHLAAGYGLLSQGQAGQWTVPQRGHPLLFNAWEALPIYLAEPDVPVTTLQGWGTDRRAYTRSFFAHLDADLAAVELAGRLPSMLLTVLLAATLWRWVTDLWGAPAGFVALGLLLCDPLALGHGRLATNDMGVTALGTLFLYAVWRWRKQPSWPRALALGLLLGITMLTKATGVLWGAMGLLWMLGFALRRHTTPFLKAQSPHLGGDGSAATLRPSLALQPVIAGALALTCVWAFYGFDTGPLPGFPLPIPAPLHWEALFFQAGHAGERIVYALGTVAKGRWWWYFPLAFLIKNPLPLLLALALAVPVLTIRPFQENKSPKPPAFYKDKPSDLEDFKSWNSLRRKVSVSNQDDVFGTQRHALRAENISKKSPALGHAGISKVPDTSPKRTHSKQERGNLNNLRLLLAFGIFYTAVAVLQGPNIGYRHMLPLHPVLHLIVAGGCARVWASRSRLLRVGLALLAAWYIGGTLRVTPHEIAYFNELAGGPAQGWRYLADSNTDWLQGWKALRAWQDATGTSFAYAGPAGYVGLERYGIDYAPLPPLPEADGIRITPWLYPEPGDYVIAAGVLGGLGSADADNVSWFRHRPPDTVIAHSLYHYRVTAEQAPRWLAQCDEPALPLEAAAIEDGFGDLDLRHLAFPCTRAWVYPAGGAQRGDYALHGDLLGEDTLRTRLWLRAPAPVDAFAARHLRTSEIAARQRTANVAPAFALYAREPQPVAAPATHALAAPAGTPPQQLSDATLLALPATTSGPLSFLGARAYAVTETLDVETWWRVESTPTSRPFSVMGHLVAPDGQAVAVDDGFAVSPLALRPGDVVVQRHTFDTSCTVHPTLWLRTGGYWLDSGERWEIEESSEMDALFVGLCRK